MTHFSLGNHDSVNILPNERTQSFMVHWDTGRNKKDGGQVADMIIFNYNIYNGHFRNVGTGKIFSKIVYFTKRR